MANLDQIQLPDNTTYDIISKTGRGLVRATMNDTTSTSTAFVVEASGISALYDGLTIVVKNTKIASASGCTLQLNNLAAKGIWLSQSNSACTTHWALNAAHIFIYNATNERWELQQGRDTNSNTWRNITVGGTSWKGTGTGTGALNFVQGSNVTLTASGNDLTIAATDTTYSGTGVISVNSSTHVISTTAEANMIDTVKVNGTALTPSNKAVNVIVPTKTSDLTNDSGFVSGISMTYASGILTFGVVTDISNTVFGGES